MSEPRRRLPQLDVDQVDNDLEFGWSFTYARSISTPPDLYAIGCLLSTEFLRTNAMLQAAYYDLEKSIRTKNFQRNLWLLDVLACANHAALVIKATSFEEAVPHWKEVVRLFGQCGWPGYPIVSHTHSLFEAWSSTSDSARLIWEDANIALPIAALPEEDSVASETKLNARTRRRIEL